ncbi:spore germination protein [Paenibacillus thalictri]|uniref:Spore germination protein n=1 Tax=Paenibacillus thalictri TaxID=2527873 RepID=A0A4Q9DMP0_9BACL|nr:spore germination protein [Paenibacillus thalictri]TBL73056.1 spore germination protein [Paenibacillus thalictri]
MPAIVGNIKILNVGPSSIVHIGDALQLAPQSTSKTFAGAGSFNTGDFLRAYTVASSTNTNDSDLIDNSPVTANKAGGL